MQIFNTKTLISVFFFQIIKALFTDILRTYKVSGSVRKYAHRNANELAYYVIRSEQNECHGKIETKSSSTKLSRVKP